MILKTKISFIIPVYNVENYLNACVDSIVGQAGDDVEILLIDDGSTDRSGDICDQYQENYDNVIAIHQENRGHSGARNAGLDMASGEYIAFVDSDDYIGAGCMDCIRAYMASGGSDICFMDACKFYPDGSQVNLGDAISRDEIRGKNRTDVMKYLATRPKYPGSAWSKIFRKDFLKENHIRFPQHLLHSEDLSLCMDAVLAAKSFDALEIPYYYYRQNRPGSVTSQMNYHAFENLSGFVEKYARELGGGCKAPDSEEASCAMAFVAYEYAILLWMYVRLNRAEKKRAFSFLKAYQWTLDYGQTGKLKMIRLLCRMTGVACASRIVAAYMRCRDGMGKHYKGVLIQNR